MYIWMVSCSFVHPSCVMTLCFFVSAKLLLMQINSKLASWKCLHLRTEGTGGWEFLCRSPGNTRAQRIGQRRPCLAHARGSQMLMFNVDHGRAPWSTVVTYGKKETIAWCPCTPPTKLETFSDKISASAGTGKEIGGKKKKNIWIAYERILEWTTVWGLWEYV